jgi:hypothetical protein
MGGRTPDPNPIIPDIQFWGPGAPVQFSAKMNPQTRFQQNSNEIQPVRYVRQQ